MSGAVTVSIPWQLKSKTSVRVEVEAPHWAIFTKPRMTDLRELTLSWNGTSHTVLARHKITLVLFGKTETPPESGPLIGFVQIGKRSYAVYHKRH